MRLFLYTADRQSATAAITGGVITAYAFAVTVLPPEPSEAVLLIALLLLLYGAQLLLVVFSGRILDSLCWKLHHSMSENGDDLVTARRLAPSPDGFLDWLRKTYPGYGSTVLAERLRTMLTPRRKGD